MKYFLLSVVLMGLILIIGLVKSIMLDKQIKEQRFIIDELNNIVRGKNGTGPRNGFSQDDTQSRL